MRARRVHVDAHTKLHVKSNLVSTIRRGADIVDCILSIDLGTTGLKAGLVGTDGRVMAAASVEYSLDSPRPGWAEQDPEAWWKGLIQCCKRLRESEPDLFAGVIGVGICGQMHTQVYLDEHLEPIRPAITWMDQRSSDLVDRLNQDPETKRSIFTETQNLATTTYTAPQMGWVQEHQPEVWSRTRHVLVAKDYLKFLLTGQMAMDFSDASGTLLFDVAQERWSEEMFRLFRVPVEIMPPVSPSETIIGRVNARAASRTGIREGTPVANGSADCAAASLGAGMIGSGQVTLIIGTAGVVAVCSDKPLPDAGDKTLCWHYCLRDKWFSLGITQTAGESLNWFKGAFDRSEPSDQESPDIFQEYNRTIQEVPDGSEGLIFLPYLNGERTPYWDSAARGVFFGINLATTKAHFIKAVMEGVSFALRNCMETIESLGIGIDRVMAVGGGLKSETWLKTLGKIIGKPIRTVARPDTGLVGNGLIALKALDPGYDLEMAVQEMVTYERRIHYPEPDPVYEKQYRLFLGLYQDLAARFQEASRPV